MEILFLMVAGSSALFLVLGAVEWVVERLMGRADD
jgi:hypothetical protein